MIPPPPRAPLFPYTTLFRSAGEAGGDHPPVGPEPGVDGPIRSQPEDDVGGVRPLLIRGVREDVDRKSTRLNSSHRCISYAVFCLKKKKYRRWMRMLTAQREC